MHSDPWVMSQAPNGISHRTPEISDPNGPRDDRGGPGWADNVPWDRTESAYPSEEAVTQPGDRRRRHLSVG